MRKIIIATTFFWCATCFAQSSIESLTFDFGTVASSAPVTHDFEFAEKIRSVVAMCECVKASVSTKKLGKDIVSVVHVELDPKDYSGDVSVGVVAVDARDRITNITLKAHVIAMNK